MALSPVLQQRGTPPENVEAVCTLDDVAGGFGITTIDLQVRRCVPSLDSDGFRGAADHAHEICPVSNTPKDNVETRVNTALED